MKITHIINNDKFPKMAKSAFEEVFPGENEFIIFTNKKELTNSKALEPKIYKRFFILFNFMVRRLVKANIVVFHSMSNDNLKILQALPKTTKTIWIGWGYDYYDLLPDNLLKEKTASLIIRKEDKSSTKKKIKDVIKKIIYFDLNKKEIINKIDIFSPVLFEDYELVKNNIPDFKPQYASWNYGTLEDDHIRGFEDKSINGNNILLGNSASETNNHLDAFDNIKSLNLANRKIIVPLSYGDTNYRDIVIKEGEKIFENKFQPLTDFMPIDDYIGILQSCSVVVMNHLRQQALGNIVIALYMGAKVFLDEKNPVYRFFIKNNAYIYNIDNIETEELSRLSSEQIEHNRKILREYWGREVILSKTRILVEMALKPSMKITQQ